MFKILFAFFVLSSFSCFGALFKKKYEEIIPFTVVGIILWLYLFYIFNILNIGLIGLLSLIALVYVIFIFRMVKSQRKERIEILKNIFTPGLLIYFLGFVAIYIITFNNEVLLWDELRLWGAYPKILFHDGGIQLADGSQLMSIMKSYNPGMPLFLFFIAKLFGDFKEGLLFFGYSLVGFSLMVPISRKITWKHWMKIPFYLFAFLIIPILFANSNNDFLTYYYTLFIEPVLGIFFGYAMFLTFDKIFVDKFKFVIFTLVLAGMVLLKDTGILFSCIAFASFLLLELIVYKDYRKVKYGFLKLFIPIILALCIFGSWKLVQNIYKSGNMYTSVLSTSEMVSFFTNPSAEQTVLKDKAYKEVFFAPIVKSNFEIFDNLYTFPILFGVLFILFMVFLYFCGKKEFKKNLLPIICFYVGSIIYLLGTLFVYFFSIHAVESFPRYISLVFTSGSVLLFLLLCYKNDLIIGKNKYYFNVYLGFVVIFCLMVLPIRQPRIENIDFFEEANRVSEKYSNVLKENTSAKDKICLVFSDEYAENFGYVIYDHQMYMDLLDEGYYFFGEALLGEDGLNPEIFDNYDYLYFISIDSDDAQYFSDILNININNSSLFRISDSNELLLIK